ncbi:hypothetical protein BH10ACI1_BH10ACI1_13090 [soil metagenome]
MDKKKIILILMFLHLAVALPLALKLNIWTDEASTLYTTQNGFIQAFQNLFTDEKQAPLYFLLMSLWRKINDSVFFARLFSIVCSLLAIIVFSRLARKIWDAKTAVFITAIFALHPYMFWASLEIRLYSFIILLTCLLFSFFYDGFLREDSARKKAQVFYVLTSIAALYTNYYLGFLLVGGFIALLNLRRWREAKSYFMQMLVVGVAILPLFYIINLQFSDRIITFQEEKSLLEGVRQLWNHFLTFVLPTEIYPAEEISVFSMFRLWIVRIAILATAIIFVKNKFKDLDKNIVAFGTISAVSAAFFLFVYFQLGIGYIEIRHAAVFFVAVFIVVSAVFVKILPKKSWIFAAVLYSIFFTYAIYALYPNFIKRGDWARVATFIEQNEKPNQPIVIFQVYDAIALPNYYKGANRILPDEKFFSFFAEDKAGSPNNFRNQIDFLIGKIPPDSSEIWLLTNEKCNVKQSCEPLEKFVEANYTIIEEKDFYKEKVRLLRKKK